MQRIARLRLAQVAKYGLLLGIVGGAAEIAWIAFYGALAGADSAVVASAVSATVKPALPISLETAPAAYGLLVHMLLAAGLGIALVTGWLALTKHWPQRLNEYCFMATALTSVWAFNFFVVLPLINPGFVELVPYAASLTSKLLFGLAGAVVLRRFTVERSELVPVRRRMR